MGLSPSHENRIISHQVGWQHACTESERKPMREEYLVVLRKFSARIRERFPGAGIWAFGSRVREQHTDDLGSARLRRA
jgi:hypothetical protein